MIAMEKFKNTPNVELTKDILYPDYGMSIVSMFFKEIDQFIMRSRSVQVSVWMATASRTRQVINNHWNGKRSGLVRWHNAYMINYNIVYLNICV